MNEKNEHKGPQHEQQRENVASKLLWIKPELITISTKGTKSGSTPDFLENASTFTFFSAS